MSFDAAQRKTFTALIKALAIDNGFTENAITDTLGDTLGGAADNASRAVSAGTVCGHVRYQAPIAAELVTIVAQANIANSAAAIAAQPAYPRKLQIEVTDANSSITAGIITVVGVGPAGEAVTETINIANGGTHTYTTANAYAKVTSITPSGLVGIDVGTDKIQAGVATAMGLPIPAGATSVVVYKAGVAATGTATAADDTVGTVDTTARTIVPNTAADGTKSFDFWFSYALPSHVHTP